jgi:tetratricopeptide (TPR) repeat protein
LRSCLVSAEYKKYTPTSDDPKLESDNIKILTNAGINLAQKSGRYQESITYYDRALAVNATYVPALYNKAVSLDKIGNHEEEAQALFDKAKELDPNYKTDFIVTAASVRIRSLFNLLLLFY